MKLTHRTMSSKEALEHRKRARALGVPRRFSRRKESTRRSLFGWVMNHIVRSFVSVEGN